MAVELPQLSGTMKASASLTAPVDQPGSSSRRDSRDIAFPELEELLAKDGKLVAKGKPPNPAAGLTARKNFSRMALKVLSKIIDDKAEPQDETPADTANVEDPLPEEPGKGSREATSLPSTKTTTKPNTNAKPVSRQNSTMSAAKTPQDTATPRKPKKPASFASLVKLATLKKKMGGRKDGSTSSMSKIAEEEELVPELPVPEKPRFCATLSAEAQYAMLKCYEDVLLDNLKTEKANPSGILYRVKTPHHTVNAIQVAGNKPGDISQQPKITTPVEAEETRQRLDAALTPMVAQGNHHGVANGDRLLQNREIRISYRFQTAMDILDTMRKSQGQLVTSPRIEQNVINPSRNYNVWSKAWCKEFQFELTKGKKKR